MIEYKYISGLNLSNESIRLHMATHKDVEFYKQIITEKKSIYTFGASKTIWFINNIDKNFKSEEEIIDYIDKIKS